MTTGTGETGADTTGIEEATDDVTRTVVAPMEETSPAPGRGWRTWLREEAWLAVELAGLCGFVFARQILGSFGASPETFIARGATGRDVVLFGLAVAFVPVLGLAGPGAVIGLWGRPAVRLAVHLMAVAGLGGLWMVQVLRLNTSFSSQVVLVLAGLAAGLLLVLRWRVEMARTFLRYAGVASVAFLVEFLAVSPTASLIYGGRSASVSPEVSAAVAGAVGEDAPPVVVVMLDALPTATLMDGAGGIDEDLYPNLAGLAREATWYRNHTTVAPVTLWAVPAFLSGTLPKGDDTAPVASAYPRNLFTLLGGVYDVHAEEQITAVCPQSLCPQAVDHQLKSLLGDIDQVWPHSLSDRPTRDIVPGAFEDRYGRFEDWVNVQDFRAGERPELFFYHLMLPHVGWEYLAEGRPYAASGLPTGSFLNRWGGIGWDVGLQRHLLQTQAVDALLGLLFQRMREAGIYDEALIVVTADHGNAFEPNGPLRALASSQFEQIMWTPLIVKAPGQTEGVVDDGNVWSIDALPMIASELGIDLGELAEQGWELDGVVPGSGDDRDPADKAILDWRNNDLRAEEGESLVHVDGEEGLDRVVHADMIEGRGPLAAWQRTQYGELLGRQVEDRAVAEEPPSDVTVEIGDLNRFDAIDLSRPLPLEVHGVSWIPEDEVVAIAVNGTVAALAPARPTDFGVTSVHAFLWPEPFMNGPNEIAFFQVNGDPKDPTLTPLQATNR